MANLGYIQVTRLCNQECRFCSNPPTKNTISYDEGVQEIQYLLKNGYDGIIFTGGEPTLCENLPQFIQYCCEKKIHCRMITNGQKISDMRYLNVLKDAGLKHLGLSVYSVKPEVQAFLSQNKNSLKNILKALKNIEKSGGITVDIITVINKYNADHLSENVRFLTGHFPFLNHFIWNNLDPTMNRATENPDTIPKLWEFEVELKKAVNFLEQSKKTYRVEKVPLCYMDGFEHASTETRKIVKNEERAVFFLDDKGLVRQKSFEHQKADCCKICTLNEICAGLYEGGKYYSLEELYPVYKDKRAIVKKILNEAT